MKTKTQPKAKARRIIASPADGQLPARNATAKPGHDAAAPRCPPVFADYGIIQSSSMFDVEQTVRRLCKSGWELQGGVALAVSLGGSLTFAQAVQRRKPADNEKSSDAMEETK